MKEVTYEEWKKNQTPRMMWVWDDDEKDKTKQKVVFVLIRGGSEWPVLTVADECTYETYKHCAEIEEPKKRRMTNQEFSCWLREKPTREYKYENDSWVFNYHEYKEGCEEEEVSEKIRIRENYGKWREPLVEVEE